MELWRFFDSTTCELPQASAVSHALQPYPATDTTRHTWQPTTRLTGGCEYLLLILQLSLQLRFQLL